MSSIKLLTQKCSKSKRTNSKKIIESKKFEEKNSKKKKKKLKFKTTNLKPSSSISLQKQDEENESIFYNALNDNNYCLDDNCSLVIIFAILLCFYFN